LTCKISINIFYTPKFDNYL